MGKCSKIRHIVWLRQMLRRWRARAAAKAAPADVPAGHVAVCVGSRSRRFVVQAVHLNHPAFRHLLRQAEEEYGFQAAAGPLALPCDEFAFENLLRHISSSSSSSSKRGSAMGGAASRCRFYRGEIREVASEEVKSDGEKLLGQPKSSLVESEETLEVEESPLSNPRKL